MILFSILLSILAHASESLWTVDVEKPESIFFDVSSSSIFISHKNNNISILSNMSLEGKNITPILEEKGRSGAIAAYGGDIYWSLENKILQIRDRKIIRNYPLSSGSATYISFNEKGDMFWSNQDGLWLSKEKLVPSGKINGLFYLNKPYFLLENKLCFLGGNKVHQRDTGYQETSIKIPGFSIQRSSQKRWIYAYKNSIYVQGNKAPLWTGKYPITSFSYVLRKDPKNDFFVVAYRDQNLILAIGRF